MKTAAEVTRELEFKRQMMIDAGMRLGLTHPETIRLSQEVDKLHNEQMKIERTKARGENENVG